MINANVQITLPFIQDTSVVSEGCLYISQTRSHMPYDYWDINAYPSNAYTMYLGLTDGDGQLQFKDAVENSQITQVLVEGTARTRTVISESLRERTSKTFTRPTFHERRDPNEFYPVRTTAYDGAYEQPVTFEAKAFGAFVDYEVMLKAGDPVRSGKLLISYDEHGFLQMVDNGFGSFNGIQFRAIQDLSTVALQAKTSEDVTLILRVSVAYDEPVREGSMPVGGGGNVH